MNRRPAGPIGVDLQSAADDIGHLHGSDENWAVSSAGSGVTDRAGSTTALPLTVCAHPASVKVAAAKITGAARMPRDVSSIGTRRCTG